MSQGKVCLIGAGPGDPGLFTLKGKEALGAADVVVYDYLAGEDLLQYCRPEAELLYAGKKGGDHTLSQQEINQFLADRASKGFTVARLKGGDPYVFGRGAEEAQALVEAGIDFQVIPGVTSAVAAAAYAGIPLTHRSYSSSVSLITGHEDPDKGDSAIDWSALARSASTLVFFMGVANLRRITGNLMDSGAGGDTPAALVRWGTTCWQRTLCGTLEDIAAQAEETGFRPPALLIVGRVVRLRDSLAWFEKKPLLGKGVVVTRAREQASTLVRTLADMGACCLQFPTIRISPLPEGSEVDEAIRTISGFDMVIFTSVNGVHHFYEQLRRQEMDSRAFGGLRLATIGPATADALRGYGLEPDYVPQRYVAEEVVNGLLRMGICGKRILIPRAESAREVLPEELRKAGCEVRVLPVYRTELAHNDPVELKQRMERGEIHYISFTSSSTVQNFFSLLEPGELHPHVQSGLRLACIGPVTAQTLQEHGFSCHVMPQEYTVAELAEAIGRDSRQCRGVNRGAGV